jgi:capsular polysaccharide biosynthesis protein
LFERRIRTVVEDRKTGLVTLTIEWKDKAMAAQWANDLVARTNAYVRQRALNLSARNLAYLNEELKNTNVVETQQAIYKLIEGEIKTTMLARGNEQYSFTVIDPAVVPQDKSNIRRLYVVLIGFFGGLVIGILWALLGHRLSERWKAREAS